MLKTSLSATAALVFTTAIALAQPTVNQPEGVPAGIPSAATLGSGTTH